MTWYHAKVKGAGAKPKRAHGYIEADSEEEAKERAEELLSDSLFGVKWVKVQESLYDEDEIQEAINVASGPNRGYRKDGSVVKREK